MRLYAEEWPREPKLCVFHTNKNPNAKHEAIDVNITPKPVYCMLTRKECDLTENHNYCSGLYHHID